MKATVRGEWGWRGEKEPESRLKDRSTMDYCYILSNL